MVWHVLVVNLYYKYIFNSIYFYKQLLTLGGSMVSQRNKCLLLFFFLYDKLYVGGFQDLVGGRNYRRLEEEAWQVEEAISRKNSSFLLEIVQVGEGGWNTLQTIVILCFCPETTVK